MAYEKKLPPVGKIPIDATPASEDNGNAPDISSAHLSQPKEVTRMADFTNPALPVVFGANSGYGPYGTYSAADCSAHTLNADVVKCGIDAISAQIDQQSALAAIRETLKSQCDLEKSISDVRHEVILNRVELGQLECRIGHIVRDDGDKTRDLTSAGFKRLDDQLISRLQLQLELTKQSCCPCGGTPAAPPA